MGIDTLEPRNDRGVIKKLERLLHDAVAQGVARTAGDHASKGAFVVREDHNVAAGQDSQPQAYGSKDG